MKKYFKLSHPQKRILMTELLFKGFPVNNIGGYVWFHGTIDINKLLDALNSTIDSMDSMRLRISFYNDEYTQYISEDRSTIEIIDLNDAEDKKLAVEHLAKEMLETPFEILDHQLFRIKLFSNASDFYGYILCMHHIIMDGWSVQLFADSVSKHYNNEKVDLGSYLTFIEKEQEYLDSERAQKDKKYWKKFVEKYNKFDRRGERDCSGIREEFQIDGEIRKRFEQLSEIYKGGNIVLAGCFLLLDYYRGGTNIIDLPNFNRTNRVFRATGGMFTSTVLIAVEFDENLTLKSYIKELRTRMFDGIRHQMWPFDLMGIDSNFEPFRYSVNYYNTELSQKLGSVKGDYHEVYPGVQMIPMQVILKTWDDVCNITFDMRKDYYHEGDGEAFFTFFVEFIDELFEKPESTIGEWLQKKKEELARLQTQSFYIEQVADQYLESFLKQGFVDINLNDIAIYSEDYVIYRGELLEYISGAVNEFRKKGIVSGNKVTICLNNSLEYIVYVYAAVFLGITFIPVDPDYSDSQIQYVFENSQSQYIITNKVYSTFPCIKPMLIQRKPVFPNTIDENEIAYILYTSGTTGTPKGVMISRKSLTAYLRWATVVYGAETFYLYSSPSFDLSITSLFLPIITKSSTVIVRKEHANLYRICSLPVSEKITAIKGTPSNLALLLKHETTKLNLKVIVCGGEELTVSLARELQNRFGRECRIYNEYGPTECTVGCMCYQYNGEVEGKAVSIGKAAPGTNVFILDNNLNMCISGKAGEIFLSGEQLATGYWQLPEENDKSFLYHDYLKRRVYKTGDTARYTKSGNIEYLGREGRQQKIHGFRVELDGIERLLKSVSDVYNAAVWVYENQLVAAVETSACSESMLTNEIVKVLPRYCVPHVYLLLDQIPCTTNGKIDYPKLEQFIKKENSDFQKHLQECTEEALLAEKKHLLELSLCELFQYSDKIESFNYFLEGGDSISALRLIAMLEQRGFHITLTDILDHPDYLEMVDCIEIIDEMFLKNTSITELELPDHVKYLSSTCDDFSNYRQINVLKINKSVAIEDITGLKEYLTKRFPVLGMEYSDGLIRKTTSIENVDFEYLEQDKEEQTIISWIKKQNPVDHLFCINALTTHRSSYLRFNVHHMLVDGMSWYQLIMATADYFSSVEEQIARPLHYSMVKERLHYFWEPYEYYMGNAKKTAPEEFTQYSKCIEGIEGIAEIDIVNAITETIFSFERYRNYSLLLDKNGREFIPGTQNEGLGCYSMMIPVINSANNVEQQLHEQLQTGIIHVPGRKCIRVNYMGHIERLFKETGFDESINYLNICISENLKNCSGYGCDFELTAWISNENSLQICLTSRTALLSDGDSNDVFYVLQEKIREIVKDNAFWSEDEELQILEEIEDDLY